MRATQISFPSEGKWVTRIAREKARDRVMTEVVLALTHSVNPVADRVELRLQIGAMRLRQRAAV